MKKNDYTFCQVGIIVPDIKKACRNYMEISHERMPQIIHTDPFKEANTHYKGITLEFIEPS